MDSGCSKHMTGNKEDFKTLELKDGGDVTFGDNSKGKIKGKGVIGKNDSTSIQNVLFVQGLKHNLLSVSQLCDSGFRLLFESKGVLVINIESNKIVFIDHRFGNVYVVFLDDLSNQNVCFMALRQDDISLWHRKLGHASLSVISKLVKNDLDNILCLGMPAQAKAVLHGQKDCEKCKGERGA